MDTGTLAATPGSGQKPGATAAAQRTITATITEIDDKVPSITLLRTERLEIQLTR